MSDKWARFLALGLALLYVGELLMSRMLSSQLYSFSLKIGRQDIAEATIETLKAIEHPISKQAQILVEICSFAGTSNVLKVQSLLHLCAEHAATPTASVPSAAAANAAPPPATEEEPVKKLDNNYQAFAVIGIALVAMGEDVGAEMSLRQFNHLVCTPK
jgi:26S proteasome regulatory subunit N1